MLHSCRRNSTTTAMPLNRSQIMSRIRSKGTKPEMLVRRTLYAMGYRYRLHRKSLPGRPDIVFPGRKKAVLVHGCFWHQHEGCTAARKPKSNTEYWLPKLEENVVRDQNNQYAIRQLGWETLTLWECQLKDAAELKRRLAQFLGRPGAQPR